MGFSTFSNICPLRYFFQTILMVVPDACYNLKSPPYAPVFYVQNIKMCIHSQGVRISTFSNISTFFQAILLVLIRFMLRSVQSPEGWGSKPSKHLKRSNMLTTYTNVFQRFLIHNRQKKIKYLFTFLTCFSCVAHFIICKSYASINVNPQRGWHGTPIHHDRPIYIGQEGTQGNAMSPTG